MADIPALYEAGRRWGVRHMFIAGWNRTGFDSFYPEYYPDMELGSAMAFRRAIEGVRAAGGFTTLYINARIFDEKSDFHATLGERMGVRDEKGTPVPRDVRAGALHGQLPVRPAVAGLT